MKSGERLEEPAKEQSVKSRDTDVVPRLVPFQECTICRMSVSQREGVQVVRLGQLLPALKNERP